MRRTIASLPAIVAPLALSLALAAAPSAAQDWQMPPADEPPAAADPAEPPSAFEQGMQGLMENMFERFRPHMEGIGRELERTLNDYGPAFESLGRLVDDMANYLPPERLPNGDVIIRRKADAPPPPPLEDLQNLLPRSGDEAPESGGDAQPGLPPGMGDPLPLPGEQIEL